VCEAEAREEVLWYLECDPPRDTPRRVLLAVDMSDSCLERSRNGVESAIQSLTRVLDAGDRCELWLFGIEHRERRPSLRPEAVLEVVLAGSSYADREQLGERLRSALRGTEAQLRAGPVPEAFHCGTWFAETAAAMLASLASPSTPPGQSRYLVVLTDGEIWDMEAVPALTADRLRVGVLRLKGSEGPAPWPEHELALADLPKFLEKGELRLSFDAGHEGPAYSPSSVRGDWVPDRGAWPRAVETSDPIRHVFLGERRPNPRFVITRGTTTWETPAEPVGATTWEIPAEPADAAPLKAAREAQLRVQGLQRLWNCELVSEIALEVGGPWLTPRSSKPESSGSRFLCPGGCAAEWTIHRLLADRSSRCSCGAILVALGRALVGDPQLEVGSVLEFPLDAAGKAGAPTVVRGRPCPSYSLVAGGPTGHLLAVCLAPHRRDY
jgi:hypothetical protein